MLCVARLPSSHVTVSPMLSTRPTYRSSTLPLILTRVELVAGGKRAMRSSFPAQARGSISSSASKGSGDFPDRPVARDVQETGRWQGARTWCLALCLENPPRANSRTLRTPREAVVPSHPLHISEEKAASVVPPIAQEEQEGEVCHSMSPDHLRQSRPRGALSRCEETHKAHPRTPEVGTAPASSCDGGGARN
jgi:hypothetical protein